MAGLRKQYSKGDLYTVAQHAVSQRMAVERAAAFLAAKVVAIAACTFGIGFVAGYLLGTGAL